MKRLPIYLALFWLAVLAPIGLAASGSSEPRDTPGETVVEFTGRLEFKGSMPHLTALIYLDDGRVYLVDPSQTSKLGYGTGTYRFKASLLPPRPAAPGLGIPKHDRVACLVAATEVPSP